MSQDQKDFSSVSPSAKSLLLMKGYTDIPYAKQTAALLPGPEVFDLNFKEKDFWFWIRVMHMESRYWSIDQLLKQTDATNILELSSGYSFRGADLCAKDERIHYIDTDLQEVIAMKQNIARELHIADDLRGRLDLLPLDVMDRTAFDSIINRFNDGPITIVNEGLLMYLDMEEKKKLCSVIHSTLKIRGGCWITADVYIKRPAEIRAVLPQSKSEANFFEQHNIEENKFDSYESAEEFFKEQGFEFVKEAVTDYRQLSVMPQLVKVLPEEVRNSKEPPPKIQATWMLRVI
ncbi:MAG: Leucine carboxyl methyltransferase [Flavipsychrobacter sp.]|nr:Leucine carboxyl methyltransferase [Flavipsychrobacter sp.]